MHYIWTNKENKDLHDVLLKESSEHEFLSKDDENSTLQSIDKGSYYEYSEKLFDFEMKRMGFNLEGTWRISNLNNDYQFCSSYPRKIIVPSFVQDDSLKNVALFRSSKRIPAAVYRHNKNGAVIARCSQPEVGLLCWRCNEDEDLVKAIAEAVSQDQYNNKRKYQSNGGNSLQNGASSNNLNGVDSNNLNQPKSSTDCEPHKEDSNNDSTPTSEDDSFQRMGRNGEPVKKVLVVDARSYTTAIANRARGGGVEHSDYYTSCDIQFMNLANIHTIRKSHQSLRNCMVSPPELPTWLSSLEATKWFSHMSGLLKAATIVAQAISYEGRPVLVHCSDGWDRTPQITSLAQLLLDPFYRTFNGFQVLVDKEWVEFGHKFSDRCGTGMGSEDVNERCPVFLQWLDCVYQIQRQYDTAFEFNNAYLVKLAQHVYSNLFGNFSCNTSEERVKARIYDHTYSVWAYLKLNKARYKNYVYQSNPNVLFPSYYTRDLQLWTSVYLTNVCCDTDELHSKSNNISPEEVCTKE